MKLTKGQIINYLVDCLGNDEDEARKIFALYGTSYLSKEQLKDCYEFNK